MTRPSLLIDLQRCMGCMSCIVACKMEQEVPIGIRLTKVDTVGPLGVFPDGLRMYYFPQGCMHCNAPACVPACPTGASYVREEDGLVLIDPELCPGCDYCITACPYGARSIDPAVNKAVKCNLCVDLIDNGGRPSCVKHCMAYARIYGDLDDPNSDINKYLDEGDNRSRMVHMLEDQGTGPSVMYLTPRSGMKDGEVTLGLH